MSGGPIYIAGLGVVSALGRGVADTLQAITTGRHGLGPLGLFTVPEPRLPVGAVALSDDPADPLPRTHRLALLAADQALAGASLPPDAIILGTTTGGILTTETLLEKGATDPDAYRYHALGSVGETLARHYGCHGAVITVSTACSSGAVALGLAMALLRRGLAKRVLAGGADALCRLTYFGFKSLQLIDPLGARPLDLARRGMSVAEGAAFVLLTTEQPSEEALQLLGAGLSCDAHHATTPLPDGRGAHAAMAAALADAGLTPADIDYINLHGTGTPDNDLAEARAVTALFGDRPPPLSSIKGGTGHTLAAAGAIEAVVAAITLRQGLVPANVGLVNIDPQLKLDPVTEPLHTPITTVLSNSFGFGGNNAAVVIGTRREGAAGPPESRIPPLRDREKSDKPFGRAYLPLTPTLSPGGEGALTRARAGILANSAPLTISAAVCLTGAGHTQATWEAFSAGRSCSGCMDDQVLCEGLPPRTIRRLKRLPKLALALAAHACRDVSAEHLPQAVSFGTAWGALSETHDFLQRLFETGQQFPSPTDFIGSVHNAPAGQIAMMLGARGANVTTSGGDFSFEQALLAADLLTGASAAPILVVGADEAQPKLSPLLDGSVRGADRLADGGGALLLRRGGSEGATVTLSAYQSDLHPGGMADFVTQLGGARAIQRAYGAIMAGIPAAQREPAQQQLKDFLSESRFDGPVIDYRRAIGQFGAASAVAAVMSVRIVANDAVPAGLTAGAEQPLKGRGVLLLGLGPQISAVRIAPQ